MTSATESTPIKKSRALSRRSLLGAVAASPAAAVLLGSSGTAAAAAGAGVTSAALDGAVHLSANDMTIATGTPSLVMWNHSSIYLPVWSLSGGTAGQSIVGVVAGLPADAVGLGVELIATSLNNGSGFETAFRVHLAELVDGAPFESTYVLATPVTNPAPGAARDVVTYTLESFYTITQPGAPVWLRVQREPGDPADTLTSPMGVIEVRVFPVFDLEAPVVVQPAGGYNSWPMIQAIQNKLVCVYSRGIGHNISEDSRAVYARTSTDGGSTWGAETVVANTPLYGEVEVGKGLDNGGAMLLWLRRVPSSGGANIHDLYRSTDGGTWSKMATPTLNPTPVQISDIFHVPTVGLMAFWFAGNYSSTDTSKSWGIVKSADDGLTWTQVTVESGLSLNDWPTEVSGVYLGSGKILAIGRTESAAATTARAQYQLTSSDYGATWTRQRTNIGDIRASTPSLVFDAATSLVANYYYHRGAGILRRRVATASTVFANPLAWPASEAVVTGSRSMWDAGNVNATEIAGSHVLAFYSGVDPDTAVLITTVNAPTNT